MGETTEIAWTDHTFNPWWGCQRVSPGCTNCYAETLDHRWNGGHWGPQAPRRFFGDKHWNEPLKWNKDARADGVRRRVFCASMADVFEDRRDLDEQRERLWRLIFATPHLDWQLLTKRPENIERLMRMWNESGDPWPNVWLGTTCEDQQRADERIPALLRMPAAVRFLSCEPLLGPVDLSPWIGRDSYAGSAGGQYASDPVIDWVIVGGESGHGARPFGIDWGRSLVSQCKEAGVAAFVKQMGALPQETYTAMGEREIVTLKLANKKGTNPAEWPTGLAVRQFPEPRHG